MNNVLIIGNPNVGKSTLFNSLTKSQEHTGNFHGVTVNSKNKIVKFDGEEFNFVDLPGIYSLNTFTGEEDVSKKEILKNSSTNLMVVDCNSLRKNLYLCLQLNEMSISYKMLLNNYNFFIKQGNKLDVKKLSYLLKLDIEIINAKKCKLKENFFKNCKNTSNNYEYLLNFIQKVKNKFNLEENLIINAFNGVFENLTDEQIYYIKSILPEVVKARYDYIDIVLNQCVKLSSNFAYGYSKLDKVLLNPFIMVPSFLLLFFVSIFLIFFKIGPLLSTFLSDFLNKLIIFPVNNLLLLITDNIWVLEFFSSGVASAALTVVSFLPQICLMFIFLTMLEDSGLIARLAYVLDDFFKKFGLNGKAVYIILLGLGCNTASTMAIKTLNGKNLKIKSAIINPYISCMARLPIYVIVASAFFGKFAYLAVVGLYLLGIIIALTISAILNKKYLRTQGGELLLEFAPLRAIDLKHVLQVCYVSAKDFVKRIFGVVLSIGIIIWILTHTKFNLAYTQKIDKSIMFSISKVLSFIFAPIGLSSEGIVCALIVGFMAKELIVSTMSIINHTANNLELISSLTISSSFINFTIPSAISFLIFSSLYCSCVSNLAVLKKETTTLTMWLSVVSQFTFAYMLSFIAYQTLTKGFLYTLIVLAVIVVILSSFIFIIKKVKQGKCLTCSKCCK